MASIASTAHRTRAVIVMVGLALAACTDPSNPTAATMAPVAPSVTAAANPTTTGPPPPDTPDLTDATAAVDALLAELGAQITGLAEELDADAAAQSNGG
jgi:hypothetical protein